LHFLKLEGERFGSVVIARRHDTDVPGTGRGMKHRCQSINEENLITYTIDLSWWNEWFYNDNFDMVK
jgi:hypothetical protein